MATTFNLVSGINVISYYDDTPINFSAIPNFDTNITVVKAPDCKVRPGNIAYTTFQSYFPGAGPLNDWLTYFGGISSYIVVVKTAFSFTSPGNKLTPPENIVVTAPLALVGIDTNRVDTYGVTNIDSLINNVYWYDNTFSVWRKYTPGLGPLNDLNRTGDSRTNNFLPGRTYYIVSKSGTPRTYTLNIPRLNNYLTADNGDFLLTDNSDNLCADG